jgi:hypothetical protein
MKMGLSKAGLPPDAPDYGLDDVSCRYIGRIAKREDYAASLLKELHEIDLQDFLNGEIDHTRSPQEVWDDMRALLSPLALMLAQQTKRHCPRDNDSYYAMLDTLLTECVQRTPPQPLSFPINSSDGPAHLGA